jgi:hypothetical protein
MSDSAQLEQHHEFAPIDGMHELRQRRTTRLWYRALQTDAVVLTPITRSVPAIRAVEPAASEPVVPIANQLAEIARIAIAAGKRAEAQAIVPAPLESVQLIDWNVVPANCPALMLSASPTLGGHMADAHLAPGVRFRVESIANGVAEVSILTDDGERVRGYCNTVDLACADPDRTSGRPVSGRARMTLSSKFKIPSLAQTFDTRRELAPAPTQASRTTAPERRAPSVVSEPSAAIIGH